MLRSAAATSAPASSQAFVTGVVVVDGEPQPPDAGRVDVGEDGRLSATDLPGVGDRHEDDRGLAQLADTLDRDQLRVAGTDADTDQPHADDRPSRRPTGEPLGALGVAGPVHVQVGR